MTQSCVSGRILEHSSMMRHRCLSFIWLETAAWLHNTSEWLRQQIQKPISAISPNYYFSKKSSLFKD